MNHFFHNQRTLRYLLILIFAVMGVFSTGGFYLSLAGVVHLKPWYAIAFHIYSGLCATAFCIMLWQSFPKTGARIFPSAGAVLALCIPGFGGITSATIAVMLSRRPEPQFDCVSDDITIPPVEMFTRRGFMSRESEIMEHSDIEPFVDIFKHGRKNIKMSALSLLSKMRSKEAVNTLVKALADSDAEVRLIAAGVFQILDEHYEGNLRMAKENYDKFQTDKNALLLAKTCIEYATSGLVDSTITCRFACDALRYANENVAVKGVKALRAEALTIIGKYDDAAIACDQAINEAPHDVCLHELGLAIALERRCFKELASRLKVCENLNITLSNIEVSSYWNS